METLIPLSDSESGAMVKQEVKKQLQSIKSPVKRGNSQSNEYLARKLNQSNSGFSSDITLSSLPSSRISSISYVASQGSLPSGIKKSNPPISHQRRKSLESSSLASFSQHVQSISLTRAGNGGRSRRLSDSNLSASALVKPFASHIGSSNSNFKKQSLLVPLLESELSTGKIECDYSLESDLNRLQMQSSFPIINQTFGGTRKSTNSKSTQSVRFSLDNLKEDNSEKGSDILDQESDNVSFEDYFESSKTLPVTCSPELESAPLQSPSPLLKGSI